MLKSIYAKGHVSRTVCREDRMKLYLNYIVAQGYNLYFIQNESTGTVIPCYSRKLLDIIRDGDIVVLKSSKDANIVVAGLMSSMRKMTKVEVSQDEILIPGARYEYHLVHVNTHVPKPAFVE